METRSVAVWGVAFAAAMLAGCSIELDGTRVSAEPEGAGSPPVTKEPSAEPARSVDEATASEPISPGQDDPPTVEPDPPAQPPLVEQPGDEPEVEPPPDEPGMEEGEEPVEPVQGCAQGCDERARLALRPRYNRPFDNVYAGESWQFSDWFQTEEHWAGGVAFRVARRSERFHAIAVGGDGASDVRVPVGRAVATLHFLLASGRSDCDAAFDMELQYADGEQRIVELPAPHWLSGCEGAAAEFAANDATANLYLRTVDNPVPDKDVEWLRLYGREDILLVVAAISALAAPAQCEPTGQESCNGLDDDCDGDVDEGEACPRGCRGRVGWEREFAFCLDPRRRDEAADTCLSAGMELTTIPNAETDVFLRDFWTRDGRGNRFWTGGTDRNEEGVWVWPDGAVFWTEDERDELQVAQSYSNWTGSAPDDSGPRGEHCLSSTRNGWNDARCAERQSFVCEAPHLHRP